MDDRTTTNYTKAEPVTRPAGTPTAPRPVVRKKRRGFGILIFLILAAAAAYWFYARPSSTPAPGPGGRQGAALEMPVVAATAVKGDIDITTNALGTVTSLATVTVTSQISGYLVRVAYQEGQMVNKGDLLAEIDSRPYELALQNAQGALERDQAMLQSAELDLKRYQDLIKTNAIPRQQLDQQVALVAQDRGTVVTDQAQIDTAKLNIAYCHIIAPVSGRVGLRLIDPGNYVTPASATGLVVITQIQPISVIFPVAEDYLPQIVKRLDVAKRLPVTAYDRSGAVKLATGELRTLDNQIDTTTGTVKLRADFPNVDNSLFPNQFVNVTLLIDVLRDTTVMPTAAVQRGAPGTFVYLVNADNTVTVKPVTLGPSSGERVAVTAGLSPGDRVVIDGADKLRNGAKISLRQPSGAGEAAAAGVVAAPPAAAAPAGNTPDRPDGGSRRSRNAQ